MQKIFFSLMAIVVMTLTACKGQVNVPAEVSTEDMLALFMSAQVDADKAAAYAKVWGQSLQAVVDRKTSDNSDMAVADLEAEAKRAQEVVSKLEALASLADGDAKVGINSAVLKAKGEMERAQHFIENHKPAAQPAAPAAQPAPVVQQAPQKKGNVFCDDPDGYVNVRKGPSANTEILTQLQIGCDVGTLLGQSGNWYKIKLYDYVGYVHKDHVRIEYH